ncbi:hypothetical protein D3C85_799690 [compost metagenome]
MNKKTRPSGRAFLRLNVTEPWSQWSPPAWLLASSPVQLFLPEPWPGLFWPRSWLPVSPRSWPEPSWLARLLPVPQAWVLPPGPARRPGLVSEQVLAVQQAQAS